MRPRRSAERRHAWLGDARGAGDRVRTRDGGGSERAAFPPARVRPATRRARRGGVVAAVAGSSGAGHPGAGPAAGRLSPPAFLNPALTAPEASATNAGSARVRLPIGAPQPLVADMGRSAAASEAWPRISCTLRRSAPPSSRWVAMTQTVRAEIRCAVDQGQGLVHDPTDDARVDPPAAFADEQCRPGLRGRQRRPWSRKPGLDRPPGWGADRTCAACPLAEHPDHPPIPIKVVDIEPAQLETRIPAAYNSSSTAMSRTPTGPRPGPPGRLPQRASSRRRPARGSAAGRARSAGPQAGRRVLRDRPFCSARRRTSGPRRPAAAPWPGRARGPAGWPASYVAPAGRRRRAGRLSRPRWPKRSSRSVR